MDALDYIRNGEREETGVTGLAKRGLLNKAIIACRKTRGGKQVGEVLDYQSSADLAHDSTPTEGELGLLSSNEVH